MTDRTHVEMVLGEMIHPEFYEILPAEAQAQIQVIVARYCYEREQASRVYQDEQDARLRIAYQQIAETIRSTATEVHQ